MHRKSSWTSALGPGDKGDRYPKMLANQTKRLDYDSEKSAEVTGHDFMPDYPPTMYREHSADLEDDPGGYGLAPPVAYRSTGSWEEPHSNETPGAHPNYEYDNGGGTHTDFTPSQPALSDFAPSQSIRVFDPHDTGNSGSPVAETYPSTPSNGHGTYLHDPNQLVSSTDYAPRRSHGFNYLSTFRIPYSASSCSQMTGETEGMTSETASGEHVPSVQFPVNFSPLDLEPLGISSRSMSYSSRLSRDSQATVIPQTFPFPVIH